MDNLKKFFQLFSNSPLWLRSIVAALVAVLVALSLLFSSCSVTQTVSNTQGDNNSTSMTVTPSQETSTSIDPQISLP